MPLFQGALQPARFFPGRQLPEARQLKRDASGDDRFHEPGSTPVLVEQEARVQTGRDAQVMPRVIIPAVEVQYVDVVLHWRWTVQGDAAAPTDERIRIRGRAVIPVRAVIRGELALHSGSLLWW